MMRLAVLLGTANPMPTLPPAPMMAVLTVSYTHLTLPTNDQV